jgi:hypothetical protein
MKASGSERVEGAGGPSESRSGTGCSRARSYHEVTGDLAPIYKEGEQGPGGPSKSERDMDFVRRTMLSAQVQEVGPQTGTTRSV